MRIDLHSHSRMSDGTDTPTELVEAAAAAGLDVVALTDHDTAAGWDEAAAAARRLGVGLVPGMEISARYARPDGSGRGVHLLAYLLDPTYPPLVAELDAVLEGRNGRVPGMVERLRALGIDIDADEIRAHAGPTAAPGRPHVADLLVAKGVVGHRDEAFERFLNAGRPAYVGRRAADLVTAIRLVREAGGVTVVAHAWGRHDPASLDAEALAALAEAGLDGLEVDHQNHDAAARDGLRAIARDLDLVVTGASDYHGTGKTDHDLGCNTTAPAELARLLDRAAEAAAAARRAGRAVPETVGVDRAVLGAGPGAGDSA